MCFSLSLCLSHTLIGFSTYSFLLFRFFFSCFATCSICHERQNGKRCLYENRTTDWKMYQSTTFFFSFTLAKSADTLQIHFTRHFLPKFKVTLLVFKYNHNGKLSILVFIYFGHFSNWNLTCSSLLIGIYFFFSAVLLLLSFWHLVISLCILFHLVCRVSVGCFFKATHNSRRWLDFPHASNCDRKRLI